MAIGHDEKLGALCMCDDCLAREQQEYDEARRSHPEDGSYVDDGPWDEEGDVAPTAAELAAASDEQLRLLQSYGKPAAAEVARREAAKRA